MTFEEYKAFETWLMRVYQSDPNVPFSVVANALKAVRANVR